MAPSSGKMQSTDNAPCQASVSPICRDESAQLRPAHALLDRLAAAGAGGDLPVGMKSDQFAAAKHGLRLLGRARDEILHQHLVGERAAGVEIAQRAFELALIAHKPDAAAGGSDRAS